MGQLGRSAGEIGLREVGRVGDDHGEGAPGEGGEAVGVHELRCQSESARIGARLGQRGGGAVDGGDRKIGPFAEQGERDRAAAGAPVEHRGPRLGQLEDAHSTSSSVSGRGTSTPGPTASVRLRKWRCPVM